MYRILKLTSVPLGRTTFFTQRSRLLKPFNKNIFNAKESAKSAHYSTVPSHEVLEQPILSKKKKQTKLRAKPYEELLKVLEARERALKNKLTEETSEELGIFSVTRTKPKKKPKEKKPAEVPEKKKKVLSERQEDFKRSLKQSYALSALKSYVEVSINADEVETAQEFLSKRLKKLRKKYGSDSTIDVTSYNVLLSGWAQKGNLDRVKQLMSMIEKDGVSPNLQTYAHYFECLARGNFLDLTEIQNVASQMKSKGLSHQDILQSCVFIGSQREKVIEALGYVDENFSSEPPASSAPYSCRLLERLNDPSHERGGSHPRLCYEEGDIPTLSDSQLRLENRFSQRIKSVSGIVCMKKTQKYRKYLEECEDTWRQKLTSSLDNYKLYYKREKSTEESSYPYLAVIDTGILVNLLLQEIRLSAETGEFFSPGEKFLFKGLGTKVMYHYFIWLNRKNEITDKGLKPHYSENCNKRITSR